MSTTDPSRGERFDLGRPRRVHVVGVGGAGMSAIAIVLAQMGHAVSGSDLKASPGLDALRALGVVVHVGHDATLVGDVEALAISTAVPRSNPEVVEAERRGIPVLRRADILASVAGARPTIAVAGTHGKTTTSSMLALALTRAGLDPSFVIGGEVNEIGTGARWTPGPWLVVEADESDGTFLELPTTIVVVTSVEPDHLEHWGGFANLEAAFARFVGGAEQAVLCADDPGAATLARPGDHTYGLAEAATHRMVDLVEGRTSSAFTLVHDGVALGRIELPLPGLHNARNAAGAAVAALDAGAEFDAVAEALGRFGGVARRFEFRGEAGGVTFVDDYAHLPTEVRAALQAARQGGWGRIVCVFQPHRFSRTEALAPSFADAFDDADVLAVTEVYASGEAPRPGVTGKLVLDAVLDAHPRRRAAWLPHRSDLLTWLRSELRPGDLCLTLGAGDLTSLPDQLLASWPPHPVTGAPPSLHAVAVAGAPLGERTTYRVGGPARWLATPLDVDALVRLAAVVAAEGLPVLVLGRGSNLLVADAGFDGLVVVLGEPFTGVEVGDGRVRAGGAAALPVVARRSASAGWRGLEWAVGVPGTVGGAVRMNAGGHGSDVAASLVGVRAVDLATGEDEVVAVHDLALGYRRSALRPTQVVVEARLRVERGDADAAEAELAEVVRWRRAHQPGGQNAGSVFTNPLGDAAGRLIDAVGAKGLRIGSARVSEKHANFIQADEGGRADDVLAVMVEVRRRVHEATGVLLQPEQHLVGFTAEQLAPLAPPSTPGGQP